MLQKKIIIHGRLIINVKIGKRILFGWTMNNSDIIGPFIIVILQEFILKKNLIATVPHPIRGNRKGRESTTEQSLGGNAAELVGWAYRGTHETSNQWIGVT